MRAEAVKWLKITTELSLYALIFALPFSKSLVEVFFVIAFVSWLAARALSPGAVSSFINVFKPSSSEMNLPLIVFTAVSAISAVTSVSLSLSMEGLFGKLFELVLAYFMVAETIASRVKLKRMLAAILCSAALVSADMVFQLISGTDFLRGKPLYGWYKITGPFANPNDLGGWLIVMLPLLLSFADFWKGDRIKKALVALSGLAAGCLIMTFAAGAWIAGAVSVVFLRIFKIRYLAAILVIFILVLPFVLPDPVKEKISAVFSAEKETMSFRMTLCREAASIVKDYPLFGCGLNTYSIVAPRYRLTETSGFYAHNSYLQMAAESGVLGLISFLWVIVVLFRTSLRALKKMRGTFYGAYLTGLLAGLLAFLVQSFVDTNFYSLQLSMLMWFMMGLLVAVRKTALSETAGNVK